MLKHWIAALLCVIGLAAWSPVRADTPMSADEFTGRYVETLRAKVPGITISIAAPMSLVVKKPGASELRVLLDNAYQLYLNDPDALDAILERYTSLVVTDSTNEKVDRSRIVAIIKDRGWPAEVSKSTTQDKTENEFGLVFDDFNGDLIVVYATDEGQGLKYLRPKDLQELALSQSELRPLAITNMRRIMSEYRIDRGKMISAIFVGEGYEASLLLFDELWAGLAVSDGEIVIAVPARDTLMFTTLNNHEGIVYMQKLAADFAAKSAYRLTDRLYVYRGGRFVRFD
jgi:uncharacterized protein YtpQ (UPF0354 family)